MDKKRRVEIQRAFTSRVLEEIRKAEKDGHTVRPSDIKEEIWGEMEARFGADALDAIKLC